MSTLDCMICGTDTMGAPNYRTLVVDVLTTKGTLHKGETVRLCWSCISAHGFMMGKEYNWRKYGDERPDYMKPDYRDRRGCPHCDIDCAVCPYAEEE